MAEGTLFYIVGPSGSGKDSLMNYARKQLAGNSGVVFAHRYITRPHATGGENHVALTDQEFAARLQAGLFAIHWESHGCSYAVGREINLWLAKGCNVVVNGSRAHLPYLLQDYPGLMPVWIQVASHVLAERLRKRGRESEEEITQRLVRAAVYKAPPGDTVIHNDGALGEAGETLVRLLAARTVAACA